jgi:hypothetical protein
MTVLKVIQADCGAVLDPARHAAIDIDSSFTQYLPAVLVPGGAVHLTGKGYGIWPGATI